MRQPFRTSAVLAALLVMLAGAVFWEAPGAVVAGLKVGYRLKTGLAQRQVLAGGAWWSYLEGGRGETVVFLHGYGADKYRFGLFLDDFVKRYHVVVPDLPGFGDSLQVPSSSYAIPEQERRLDAFIRALGLKRFSLVGISMGGYLAGYFAAAHPQQVERLVLMDAAGVRSPRQSEAFRLYFEQGKNIFLYRNVPELDAFIDILFYRPPWIPHPLKRYAVRRAAQRAGVRRKVLADLISDGWDLLGSRLGDIRMPTLIIWGRQDRVIDPSSVEIFSREIPDPRVVWLDRCGHVPYLEHPVKTRDVMLAFLAS